MKPFILTHRGLDPDRTSYFRESSLEAFGDQLERGYGLEFDVQVTVEGKVIVAHHKSLDSDNLLTTSLESLVVLIQEKASANAFFAIHIKHIWQNSEILDVIIPALSGIRHKQCVVFDVTIDTALYIKSLDKRLMLAPSVAHPYDIERYNRVVGGTLLSIEEVIANKELFEWVWLDEWDRTDRDNVTKSFYNVETFLKMREHGFKIALVSPELHATSPGLLGGESHPDGVSEDTWSQRIQQILSLSPDAICTDFPDRIRQLLT